MKDSIVYGMTGFLIAVVGMSIIHGLKGDPFLLFSEYTEKQFVPECALLGDIGGTNIRLQLVLVKPKLHQPLKVIKKEKLSVAEFDELKDALTIFLSNVQCHPSVAVIAIAGPINQNSVKMGNVAKWGTISGFQLGRSLNISFFKLINDFQAVSYGTLLLTHDDLIGLNDKKIIEVKTRGVMGPGTGLGHSVIYTNPAHFLKRAYVLPSEGGQTDFPLIDLDHETTQFYLFLKNQIKLSSISMQKVCSGPTIPYIYQYFAKKYPEYENSNLRPSSEEIISMIQSQTSHLNLASMTVDLFLKFYGNAIGNFMAHHLPLGGVYLVGGLTEALLPRIQQIDILKQFKERHPQISSTIQSIPLVFSKQIDLGLRGAFVYARRAIKDKQLIQ